MSGTVNISRGIWHDTAFKPQPFTEREAFMWIIMEASYKAREKRVGGVCVNLERGQLATSLRFMAEAWGWQKSTVDRFINRLKKRDMIGTASGTGITVITVCKYEEYQNAPSGSGTPKKQKRDSSGTAAGQQRDKPNKGLIPEAIPEEIHTERECVSFSDFWEAYPSPVEEPAAEREWLDLIKAGKDAAAIVEAARVYAGSGSVKRGYAKKPANWLRDGGWDQPAKPVEVKASPDETAQFWAKKIKGGGFVAPSAIGAGLARHMLDLKLVTQGDLRAVGVNV